MRRSVFFFVILTMLFAGYTNHADAQFFKKLFGGKGKPKEQRKTSREIPVVVKPVKKKDFIYPVSVKKKRYQIDVLVPLYLNELVVGSKPVYKGRIPERAAPGIDFYHGIKLATDSLNSSGYELDVHVHDIMDSSESINALIKNKVLESSDLIIGAIQSQQIPAIAEYAKKKQINFISALSPADGGVKNNPFFTLLQPSLLSHCEWIADKTINKPSHRKPLVFYRTSSSNDETAFKDLGIKDGSAQKLLCNVLPTRQTLASYLDSAKTNVIIVAILDVNYAEKLLQNLKDYFPAYKFEVYGMPSWRNAAILKKPELLTGFEINITAPYYFDMNSSSAKAIAGMYKKETGSGKISEMVYRGYETMFFYANMLNAYGTIFNEKYPDKTYLFTNFDVKLRMDNNSNLLYQENRHIFLYKYVDGNSSVQP